MRLLSAITLALAPVAGFAAQDITKDETVRGFVTTSVIAAKVANGCDKLTISSAGLTVLQTEVFAYIEGQGYGAEEAAGLQDEAFNREIGRAADAAISEQGFDPKNARDLCAFGKKEMTKGSAVGSVLESR